ncbi:GYF domain-containing protein [Aporhodopirellula aestuarii]|uniref:GYF domain-containing protein n=1 Tax=Aporhodopirellula aestuarii TaxID=2950107 RepID=A0ABT0UEE4_9BACT|nr:GYF domain-containing protein [Aporhodopirellula aestuarii]MCM2375080.1 GYF domain-containing protein [Aporhodopirellula aestuarii]
MSSQWYVQYKGKIVGPASARQLKGIAQQGKIDPDTLVRLGEDGNWTPASRVKGLFESVSQTGLIASEVMDEQQPPKVMVLAKPDTSDSAHIAKVQPVHAADSALSRFVSDGQPPKVVGKLLSRVTDVCTDVEQPEYIAVQHLPSVMSPDAIVLTNKRVIIFRSKALGRMNMVDVPWLDVQNIHISEGIVGATLSVSGLNGHVETLDHLPKAQARCVYRVGQQREEEMREYRRSRKMEEERNAANSITVNTAVAPSQPALPTDDLTSRLNQLKQMLDAGLIERHEFDAKKAEILASL